MKILNDLIQQAQSSFKSDIFFMDHSPHWGSASPDYRTELRKCLSKYFQIHYPDQVNLTLTDLKKLPVTDRLFISISHCPEFGCFVISSKPVGLDVERLDRLKKEIIQRVCTEKELSEAPEPQLLWSAKEAVFKCSHLYKVLSDAKIDQWQTSQNETFQFSNANQLGWIKKSFTHMAALVVKNS